jgi:hypothetical protein
MSSVTSLPHFEQKGIFCSSYVMANSPFWHIFCVFINCEVWEQPLKSLNEGKQVNLTAGCAENQKNSKLPG